MEVGLVGRSTLVEGLRRVAEEEDEGRLRVMRELFRDVGCAPSEHPVGDGLLPNLACTLPGETGISIVVGAHYDKVEAGRGAVDNGSGVVLLPALYASLATRPRRHTFEFVAFSSEERGLLGSSAFVRSLGREQLGRIATMVNLDSLGTGPVRPDLVRAAPELVCGFWEASSVAGQPLRGLRLGRGPTSDYEPFLRRGVAVIGFSSLTDADAGLIHTRRDTLERIDETAWLESYRVLAIYLAILDQRPEDAAGEPARPAPTR